MNRTAVVAIGGNSLIKDKDHQTVPDQYQAVAETCVHIADMIQAGWDVVVTHGNGPQVGFILLRSDVASHVLHTVPLDSCGADTQGAIGYHIQRALRNQLIERGLSTQVVTVVTQVVVDAKDPAFQRPSKPIGPFFDQEKAKRYQQSEGWTVVEDAGRGYRRVVASPEPKAIVELASIKALVENGFVVVAVGGGGIPVFADSRGVITEGAQAVIDKDYASSLLATELGADLLLISTAVDRVYVNYGRPDQTPLVRLSLSEALRLQSDGQFPPGSMGPKIEAALRYLKAGGKEVIITSPECIGRAVRGEAGTHVVPD
jgi:carbamate kinase